MSLAAAMFFLGLVVGLGIASIALGCPPFFPRRDKPVDLGPSLPVANLHRPTVWRRR